MDEEGLGEAGIKYTDVHRTLKVGHRTRSSALDDLPRETEGEGKVQKGKNQSVGGELLLELL